MHYAGFPSRFYAAVVDTLVLLPVAFVAHWVFATSHGGALLVNVPFTLVAPVYQIWFHARSGQTIGKRVANIRVLDVSGGRISWRAALLRSSVDIALAVAELLVILMALPHIADAEIGGGALDRHRLLVERGPAWAAHVRYAAAAWSLSELVFLLFNDKHRALHDFIAGTVVVRDGFDAVGSRRPLGAA
jgi:uncharacterized RDD family membrane protein YckC